MPFLMIARSSKQTLALRAFEVAPVHPVFHFQVPDGRFNGSPAFEQLLFFIRQALELAAVLDVNARCVLVDLPVAQVNLSACELHARTLIKPVQSQVAEQVAQFPFMADRAQLGLGHRFQQQTLNRQLGQPVAMPTARRTSGALTASRRTAGRFSPR